MRTILFLLVSLCSLTFHQNLWAEDADILFVTGQHGNKAKISLLKRKGEARGLILERKSASKLPQAPGKLIALFDRYQLVVLEGVSVRESKKLFASYAPLVPNSTARFLAISWLENEDLRQGLSATQAQRLHDYYHNGGEKNLQRMVDYLSQQVLGDQSKAVPKAIIYPEVGIYHPEYEELIFHGLEEYLQWKKVSFDGGVAGRPVIGVLLRRASIEAVETQVIDATIARLEARGAIVVPFFFELRPQSSDYNSMIERNGETLVDVIINYRTIHWSSQRLKEFEAFGVPVMQALTYFDGNQQQWEQDTQGINAGMTPFILALPEAAGVVDPMIVAAIDDITHSELPIDYQLNHMVDKALKVAALKHLPNADKKLTVMVWGEKNIGASFLNVPESLSAISSRLNAEGYNIEAVNSEFFTQRVDRILQPFYRGDVTGKELEQLVSDDLAQLMPVADYSAWFDTLPESVRKPIDDYWGQPKDNFMVIEYEGEAQFVLPRIRNGNLLVMRQPPRADDRDEDKRIFHKGDIPMNHYYLAAYYYARQFWGSDALVHLGTHGSQEYLSGKERGLSIYDQGNLAVWDTPVLYPFIVDDVGEAMQTKRRGRATVIAHMTPPFAAAGLQGDVADIHELMHQYKSLDSGGVKLKTASEIVERCLTSDICTDFGWDQDQIDADFEGFIGVLHDYLVDLASQNQPLGLHTFGLLAERRLLVSTLLQMLGRDFVVPAAIFEADFYAGENNDDVLKIRDVTHRESDFDQAVIQSSGEALETLVGFKTLRDFVLGDAERSELDEELLPFIDKAAHYYQNLAGIRELESLVDGLAGRFVSVKNGGDPVRNPAAVPTGLNLYGFDPSRVPTRAAYAQGSELVEQVIADYYQQHGNYPDKLAFSLWSIETMRHYGVLESQALYAMGVCPQWSEDGRVIGTEIIPASELGRPRIDVVLSATGLYRDAFPNVMQWLAKAIEEVAQLKEESNFVWRNSQRVEAALIEEGVEPGEAEYLSTVRVFSSASGRYGSGVEDAVVASDTWDSDAKIADLYLAKMGYFYGSDNSRWGEKVEGIDLYGKQLSGTDVAMFSRSSNVYGMLSSDDPFEYFGSLSMAVRNLDGKSPEMIISNLRDADNSRGESAAIFLAKELRSRMFHKRWIQEMQKEGYSGATALASRMTNFWGWQVVDPNLVRDDQWQEFFEVYVEDKLALNMDAWFEEVNPMAQAQMLERMLEAVRKDYWQANDQTLTKMLERYADLVNQYDLLVDNEALQAFVNEQAAGFGLSARLPVSAEMAAASVTQEVQGQQLEKVEKTQAQDPVWETPLLIAITICLLSVLAGALLQLLQRTRRAAAVG